MIAFHISSVCRVREAIIVPPFQKSEFTGQQSVLFQALIILTAGFNNGMKVFFIFQICVIFMLYSAVYTDFALLNSESFS